MSQSFRREILIGLLLGFSLCISSIAAAVPAAGKASATPAAEPSDRPDPPVDLMIANRRVFTFRASHLGVSPAGRAEGARGRIEAWADRGVEQTVEAQERSEGFLITVGGQTLFRITPGDIDTDADETLRGLVNGTTAALGIALAEELEARNFPRLLRAFGWTAAATLLLALCLWLVGRGVGWALARSEKIGESWSGSVGIAGYRFVTAQQLESVAEWTVRALGRLAGLVLLYLWLTVVFAQFPYTRTWGEQLGGYVISVGFTVLRAVTGAIPGLILVAVILSVTRFLTKIADAFFSAVARGEVSAAGLHQDTAQATRLLVNVLLWLLAVALSYPFLPGSGSAAFQGVSLFAGLVFSLGSTNLVGQLTSGLVIVYSRKFRAGDYVRIGATEGVVTSVGVFETKIRTNKREEVSLPHSVVISQETKNFSRAGGSSGVVLYTSVTIGYDVPWRQIHEMLILASNRTEGLMKEPPPFVYQTALSDFYVEYQLNACLALPEERMRVLAALHANIQDVFNENGVQIMSPHYEADPSTPKVVPRDRWQAPPIGRANPG